MDPKEKEARNRLKKLKQIEKQIGLNKMTPTQRKSLRQLKRIYPVNPGSKFVMKKDEDMKPSIENKKNLTSTSVRKPTKRLKQVNINPPRANTSSATSVRKPTKRLKQPKINNKSKEKIKKSTDDGRPFVKKLRSRIREDQLAKSPPQKESTVSSLLKFLRNKFSPSESISTTKIKKALPSDGTYTAKQIKSLEEALTPSVPFSVNERNKVTKKVKPVVKPKVKPVVKPKVKPVVKPKVKSVVKPKVKPTQSEKILKAQPKPTVKPSKAPTDKDQEEINKNVKADPKITAKSLPAWLNNPIAKEIIKSRGGEKAFAKGSMSSKIGKNIFGEGDDVTDIDKMKTSVYNTLRDEYGSDAPMDSKREAFMKTLYNKKGGMVKRKYGGKIKRNMGGKVATKKKTVFRRGGGQALRGFGKATYSNKMY